MLIPKNNGYHHIKGTSFLLPQRITWRLESVDALADTETITDNLQEAMSVFAQRMKNIGTYEIIWENPAKLVFSYDPAAVDNNIQAYILEITETNVKITAADIQGFSYGLTTLFQYAVFGNGKLDCGRLEDAPKYEKRGVMLDVCRHFFSVDEVKKIIEQCALLKMNHFHWHLSDDQGFRVESTRFPLLNTVGSWRKLAPEDPVVLKKMAKSSDLYGGYYTKQEIREVVAYAKARQIEVIPEIDLPGHSSAILAAYPQFTCSGEPLKVKNTFGIHERIFCAGKESGYHFLCELLDELLELFPSKYFHLGGDEAPKTVWHECSACNKVMTAQGFENYEQLQSYFTSKMIKYLEKKGKIPIVWNDSAASGMLDDSAIIQYWIEMAPGESYVIPELANGRKLMISSMHQFYCNSDYADMPLRATLMYEPEIKGITVPAENVLGIEAPMWTEWAVSNEDIEKKMYPRLLAVAECAWTKKRSIDDFMKRMTIYLKYEALNVLKPMPWEIAMIDGEAALKAIAENMLLMGRQYGSMTTGETDETSGKVEAVVPEGSVQVDMATRVRSFVWEKMKGAYTKEDFEKVVEMIMAGLGV